MPELIVHESTSIVQDPCGIDVEQTITTVWRCGACDGAGRVHVRTYHTRREGRPIRVRAYRKCLACLGTGYGDDPVLRIRHQLPFDLFTV